MFDFFVDRQINRINLKLINHKVFLVDDQYANVISACRDRNKKKTNRLVDKIYSHLNIKQSFFFWGVKQRMNILLPELFIENKSFLKKQICF